MMCPICGRSIDLNNIPGFCGCGLNILNYDEISGYMCTGFGTVNAKTKEWISPYAKNWVEKKYKPKSIMGR